MKTKAKLAKGRFTGDPSYEFEHVEIKKNGEGEEATEEEETVSTTSPLLFFLLIFVYSLLKLFITGTPDISITLCRLIMLLYFNTNLYS